MGGRGWTWKWGGEGVGRREGLISEQSLYTLAMKASVGVPGLPPESNHSLSFLQVMSVPVGKISAYSDTCFAFQDFREKNSDLVRPEIVSTLKKSSMAFVRELMGMFVS